ncbi:MAG: hypothetical protein M1828_000387 [Chrysothrix sp. TS-e1954]|nr:MAG: hypothetical protein M1828_000387 [Chrysothrix sp. TS-e1954]
MVDLKFDPIPTEPAPPPISPSTTPTTTKAKPKPTSKPSLSSKLASASAATSRTASPAPDSFSSAPNSTSKQSQTDPDDPTKQRCKHCKLFVPKLGFSTHSKQCLRDKQEATRLKREAQAQALAAVDGSAVPDNISGKLKDGKTKADAKDLKIVTSGSANGNGNADSRQGTAGPGDNDSVLSAAPSLAGDNTPDTIKKKPNGEKKGKKRKADKAGLEGDGDTASVAGSINGSKPPNKKQKKKDTPADPSSTTAATSSSTKKSTTTSATTTDKPSTTANSTSATTTTGGGGGKPKGPVDVERQCGVLLPNGSMCARSLTCKSHPMGAKRAVPGRSLPYDMLLAQWTKKNQAKQQKAAMESNQTRGDGADGPDGGNGAVDSDEETEKVMVGIRRAAPRPLAERVPVSVGGRYGVVRVKEVLREAMGGSRGGGLFSLGPRAAAWSAGAGTNGAGDDGQARRAQSIGGSRQVSTGPGSGAAASQDGMRKSSAGLGIST